MPVFLSGLFAGLSSMVASRVGYWALSLLAFFGIQWFTSSFVADPLIGMAQGYFAGAPGEILQWLAFLNVDKYVTGILSAYAAAASIGALKLRKRPA